MITDLLKPHQERQDQPLPLDSIRLFQHLCQFLHRLLIEGSLFTAELAECLDLSFVRQVGNHGLISLQPSQDVWPHQFAQWSIWIVRPVRKPFGEGGELLCRSKQAGIDKVKDGPQISQPVFNRGARKREPGTRFERFSGAGLPGSRVLDGLRLVKHHKLP